MRWRVKPRHRHMVVRVQVPLPGSAAAPLGSVQGWLNWRGGLGPIEAAHRVCVALAISALREEHLQYLAGSGECAIAIRPHAEVVAVEVILVHFDAAHPLGRWLIESGSPVVGDAFGDFVEQPMLDVAVHVEDDELGMAEILDEPDGVAERKVVVADLDDRPAVDLDLQVERLHDCFVGVTITLETHVGIMDEGCHRDDERATLMQDRDLCVQIEECHIGPTD